MSWKDILKGFIRWTPDRYNEKGQLLCENNCIRPASEDTIFARMPGKSTKPSTLCQWCSDDLGKREKPPFGFYFYDKYGNKTGWQPMQEDAAGEKNELE